MGVELSGAKFSQTENEISVVSKDACAGSFDSKSDY